MISVILLLLPVFLSTSYAGQSCLSCSAVENSKECHHRITCNEDEICYMHQYLTESNAVLFDYGCASKQSCSLSPIFGRRSEGHHVRCTLCCDDSNLCNENLDCNSTNHVPTELPRECSDIPKYNRQSGVYTIYPFGTPQPAVSVYCHKDIHGYFWTVIQHRFNGTVNFYRGWQDYKHGFGQPDKEYWLGNDIIHELTTSSNHALMIEMTDFSNVTKYAEYHTFYISSEDNGYRLDISKYDGTAGDSLFRQNGKQFSTYDRDNDASSSNCAVTYKGAWWYNDCHDSNLNGMYLSGHHDEYATGMNWYSWHGYHYSLKTTLMMIRKY